MSEVHLLEHPLIQHKLTHMRKKGTSTAGFRRLLSEISLLMGYEVTRDMSVEYLDIDTPLAEMRAPILVGKKIALISVLRAGQGLLEGLLELIPLAKVGHVGLYRDPVTLDAIEYYFKLPEQMSDRDCLVVDPMLATGHSATAAVERIKETNPKSIKFLCLLAAPPGIQYFHEQHPDVPLYTAAIDPELNEKGYIVPGLGDAGDRLYGTA